MASIPRLKSVDSTLALLSDPYGFISERCRQTGSDLFETRIMLRKTICMMGKEPAELFYNSNRFIRSGAVPGRIQKTLFGRGGVQGLDGEAHRHRKKMMLSLMTPERIDALGGITDSWWRRYARKWESMESIVLYNELHEILTRSVCEWAGVPLAEEEVGRRTYELTALFDMAGAVGPRHWVARLSRIGANRWIGGIIREIRERRLHPPEESAAALIAWHRNLEGDLLNTHVAAVELLNILRPVVAVSVFITFAALALYAYPECREKIKTGQEGYDELFVQEVRRYYPFFPAVMALVRDEFTWKGFRFSRGRRVLLDLYGTNNDPRIWERPQEFFPERFRSWEESPYTFIPQGGGIHGETHRCPGEWITIDLLKRAARFLSMEVRYRVPKQDLKIDHTRLPALPKSRFMLRDVALDTTVPNPMPNTAEGA